MNRRPLHRRTNRTNTEPEHPVYAQIKIQTLAQRQALLIFIVTTASAVTADFDFGQRPARFTAATDTEAGGRVVAPGFIDDSHYADIAELPVGETFVRLRVTIMVTRNR